MSAILNIVNVYPPVSAPRLAAAPKTLPPPTPAADGGEDRVEISPLGRAMAEAAQSSSLRLARIRAIRAEIENGTYETPERIAETARRLLKFLR
ncbi:MAG: flagellar biosynthesis anti-sigma factor FlgM [Planctomycetota bacterium]|nr:MAG: flagellar biosynthesis anti-sigma factor FlgM [Planctomycetota bacterium]